jgi:CubicO group peptidase (beta-lactamase class C family)
MNTAPALPPPTAGEPSAQPLSERIRAIADRFAADAQIPSISIAVARPNGLLHADAVGFADLATRRPATTDDQYLWFSMSKIATATAAMRLHSDGRLDLDAPVGDYLPGYRPHPRHGHPTMHQLLTHTAGLGNPLPLRWVRPEQEPAHRAQLARIVDRHGTPRKPVGAQARYSNIGYLLAGNVIEAATGRSIEECVHDLVLTPLGMSATGYHYDREAPRAVGYARLHRPLRPVLGRLLPAGVLGPQAGPYASLQPFLVNGPAYGGLIGTAADAAKLAAAHAAAEHDAHPVLDQAALEQMRTISMTGKRFDHGIGWFRKPTDAARTPRFVEHYGTGGGFWNAMRIYPQDRLAIVAMANTTTAWDVDGLFTHVRNLSCQ